jgi:predicted TIM-barrel fold metal-dependent hydrolase
VPRSIVSADSHINEPPELWTKAAPAHLADRVPHVVETDKGDAWVVHPEGEARPVSTSAVAGLKPEDYMKEPVTYKRMRPGSFDPTARLEDMNIDSVSAEVLYPGIGRLLSRVIDEDTRLFCAEAYNNWIAEFQSVSPERLIGLALLPPLDDGQNARQELERAHSLGLRGALLSYVAGGRPLSHPEAEPFWELAEEKSIPISLHIGSNNRSRSFVTPSDIKLPGIREAHLSGDPMQISEHIAVLIFGGVLDRHPRLSIVIAESGIGWIPYLLTRMDSVYERHRHYLESKLTRPPSEVFHGQVYATFQEDQPGLRLRDLLGVENIMWASDYPHTDTTWPNSLSVVKRDFVDVSDAEADRILELNCMELYGL